MVEREQPFSRPDPRDRTKRDVERFRSREAGGGFWRSLGLVGSVGWPIVLLAIGGAMFGRYLDGHFGTGVRCTLISLTVGTFLGCFAAYRTLRGNVS